MSGKKKTTEKVRALLQTTPDLFFSLKTYVITCGTAFSSCPAGQLHVLVLTMLSMAHLTLCVFAPVSSVEILSSLSYILPSLPRPERYSYV